VEPESDGSRHAHILSKFVAEFDTYWNSREFVVFDADQPEVLRHAIQHAPNAGRKGRPCSYDITPHPFQERILDALESERGDSRSLEEPRCSGYGHRQDSDRSVRL
jgi:hypothetical protein